MKTDPIQENNANYEAMLVEQAVEGRPAAVEAVCRLYEPRVTRTVKRFLARDPDADDVVQETFRQVCKSITGFQGRSSLYTWIHRIALNTCFAHARARRRRNEHQTPVEAPELHAPARGTGTDPADIAASRAHVRDVLSAVDRLCPSQRTVMVLGPIQGHSYASIASVLKTSIVVVKGRLHRARETMRRLLDAPATAGVEA